MRRDEGCMVRQVPSTGGGGLYLDHQRMKGCCREIFRMSLPAASAKTSGASAIPELLLIGLHW